MRLGLIVLLFLNQWAFAAEAPARLEEEIQRLEKNRSARSLFSEERFDLASLYFLQKQCGKVAEVLTDKKEPFSPLDKSDQALLCACDGKCDLLKKDAPPSFQERLFILRQFVKSNVAITDPELQKNWQALKESPQAKYLMYLRLKASGKPEEKAMALKLLKELQTMNVVQ